MNKFSLATLACTVMIMVACTPAKKATPTTAATPPAPPPIPSAPSVMYPATRPETGFYPPRNEELLAIQVTHPQVTMQQLNEGYNLYTGACVQCHTAANISQHTGERWVQIIDDMAPKANLTPAEKEAVSKYVFSVKAAQAQGK